MATLPISAPGALAAIERGDVSGVSIGYLSSAQGPQLSSRDGWEVLGREFRVTLDFGAGATDHRGAYRNAGA